MPGKYAEDEKCQRFVANLKRMREAFGWSQERDTTNRAGAVLAISATAWRALLAEIQH